MRDALGGSLDSLGRSRPTSANLGQSRPISANPGQPRPTSANLGQPRPISASLGHPRPPLAHAPTTSAHAPNNHGPRANLLWSMAGPSSALPPSPPATPQSSPVSSVTGHSTEPEPARHPRRPPLRPYATRAEGSEIDRGARRTRLLPHTNHDPHLGRVVVRGAPSHTDLLGSVLTAPHTSITTRRAACRGPSPALEGVETGPTASAVMNGGE